MTTSSIFRTISNIDAHRGEGKRVVGLDKFGHKNAIKHENRRPPRFSANLKNPLKIIFPKPPSGFSTSANL
jgi:hypothetical protein